MVSYRGYVGELWNRHNALVRDIIAELEASIKRLNTEKGRYKQMSVNKLGELRRRKTELKIQEWADTHKGEISTELSGLPTSPAVTAAQAALTAVDAKIKDLESVFVRLISDDRASLGLINQQIERITNEDIAKLNKLLAFVRGKKRKKKRFTESELSAMYDKLKEVDGSLKEKAHEETLNRNLTADQNRLNQKAQDEFRPLVADLNSKIVAAGGTKQFNPSI